MVAPTCFSITLPSSGSVPSAFWDMLNWGAVDRILWMGVLCLVTWCVAMMACRAPAAILRQWRVLRESPRGSWKYPNCKSYSLWIVYASDHILRGTPRGSQKNPNVGRSPTCRLWISDANLHIPCHAYAALCRGLKESLSERYGRVMARARRGRGIACVNLTRPHCVNQMGNTQSKPLGERHGNGMVCENWPNTEYAAS
jgi:hypothetical protein